MISPAGSGEFTVKRVLMAAMAMAAGAGVAFAAGYDDFTEGLTANVRDNPDGAIAAFTAALKSGDLVPSQIAASYRGRAAAYLELRKCEAADADLKSYAAMHALEHEAILLRARIRMCLGDGAGAKVDWQTFAGAKPGAQDHWAFARMLWSAGLFGDAYDAMLQAVDLVQKQKTDARWIVLWFAVAAERAGKGDPAKLADLAKTLDTREWPMTLLNFYLGKVTKEQVLDKADSWLADKANRQTCEADFYLAEWYLAHKDTATAKPLLSSAVDRCPKNFIERSASEDELKRLDQPPKDALKGGSP